MLQPAWDYGAWCDLDLSSSQAPKGKRVAAAPAAIKKVGALPSPYVSLVACISLAKSITDNYRDAATNRHVMTQDKAPAKPVNPLFEKREKRFGGLLQPT